MGFFTRLERRIGRYAIPHLIIYLMVLYLGGLLLQYLKPGFYEEYLALSMSKVFEGEVYRLVTYLIYPPSTNILYCLLICFIYYSLGTNLERLWGRFYFNLYVFIGLIANVLAALAIYLIWHSDFLITPDSLYMSFLLAFALTLPDAQFYIMFVIPIKAKYLAVFYGILIVAQIVIYPWPWRIQIIASIVNFVIFFTLIRHPVQRVQSAIRLSRFRRKVREANAASAHHRCAVCGRTEQDDPSLEFRYCSKCAGNREYCLEHLYTHVHVTDEEPRDPYRTV